MIDLNKEPKPNEPAKTWPHYNFYKNIRTVLQNLPIYFRTETYIEGILATDIFTLNTALGATIEEQVVTTLNQMRFLWDSDDKYTLFSFKRQSQTFPDVLFKTQNNNIEEIIFGIELKGWYLLSKEGEPSFRYQVTPSACSEQDLLVVVPWSLKNVISGKPQVFSP